MFCSRWIRGLLPMHASRNMRRRRAAKTRRPVRLILEALEERLTPSQTAGSYNDLVSAIAADTAANTNYIIDITNNFTFNSGGQVSISALPTTSTLTIEGQGGTNFTLTGNGNRLFDITGNNNNVTLANLTLTGGGNVEFGGAIADDQGNVTLSGVTVVDNTATSEGEGRAQGGGVYVGDGSMTIKRSTIANNVAQGSTGNAEVAYGGGVYISGSHLQITDSILSNNRARGGAGFTPTTAGAFGGSAGSAYGGGVFASGEGWTVTLTGDMLSGNQAVGGAGGAGAAGVNAPGSNNAVAAIHSLPTGSTGSIGSPGGPGGPGGNGGNAAGGGLYAAGTGSLTILNDLGAPISNPSTWIDNSTSGGAGGLGGAGGNSAGNTANAHGGVGGNGGSAEGGAVAIDFSGTSTIGNTTFYGNLVHGGDGGSGGAGGTGGLGARPNGTQGAGGMAQGGGVYVSDVSNSVVMVNGTLAKNVADAGNGGGGMAFSSGGAVYFSGGSNVVLDNNTITRNAVSEENNGGGIAFSSNDPTLINNLIQGNLSGANNTPSDLAYIGSGSEATTSNNFITAVSSEVTLNSTNIVNKATSQLGATVGVNGSGTPTGGPIYYPLLTGALSVGAGSTSVLNTIATAEGTTSANDVDEIGSPRSSNNSISLGAVQPLTSGGGGNSGTGGTSGTGEATTVVPGNASVNFSGTNPSPAFQVPVAVNSDHGGTASGGSVSLSVVSGNTTTSLGSANVGTNGVATVSVAAGALPANLQAGTYELVETYSGNAPFDSSDAFGTLTLIAAPALSSTSIIPGNGSIGSTGGTATIPLLVNSPAGTVNFGTVTISLVNGSTTVVGSANMSGGAASVTASFPAHLAPGSYSLIETYADSSGHFGGSSALGALTVNPPPPPPSPGPPPAPPQPPPSPDVAAIEVSIDVVAWLLWGKVEAERGSRDFLMKFNFLESLMEVFANRSLPGPAFNPRDFATSEGLTKIQEAEKALTTDIQSLLPLTQDMGLSAIELGLTLASNFGIAT